MTDKYDVVDVHISGTKSILDSILEHPILDGERKYTIACTEFTAPLNVEPPLPLNSTFALNEQFMRLMNVKRKNGAGVTIITQIGHNLSTLPAPLGTAAGKLIPFQTFLPDSKKSIQTINDLVFYMQNYFTEIKRIYSLAQVGNGAAGIVGADHGGVDFTPLQVAADPWVRVSLTPNCRIRFILSPMFASSFFIQFEDYSQNLFGVDEVIAFGLHAGDVTSGIEGLVGPGNSLGDVVINGNPAETCIVEGRYPLSRFFDHRVMIDLDSGGMPIPNVIAWTTSNKQSQRNTLATFPINLRSETSIYLNNIGGATGDVDFKSELLQGNVVWRRAEDKVSERFQILNSQFFQNIRLEVLIERREWDQDNKKYVFKRRNMLFGEGDSWTAKLRFKTLK
jgi:hypothetical protein